MLFRATKFMVECYSSSREPIGLHFSQAPRQCGGLRLSKCGTYIWVTRETT